MSAGHTRLFFVALCVALAAAAAAASPQDHGNAPNSTSPPAASRVAPSTQAALAVPISPSASPRSAAPPTTTAQAQPAVIDAASEGDDAWGDEWAAAGNGTWNGTDAADADGSEGEQPEGADWGVLYLVIIIIVATVAGVGALVGACHGAGVCEETSSCSDHNCTGNDCAAGGFAGGGDPLTLCAALLLGVVVAAAVVLVFFVGWGIGFALTSPLGLLCPISWRCRQRRERLGAVRDGIVVGQRAARGAREAAAARAAAAAAGVQLPSAKVTLSDQLPGKLLSAGPSSQENEAPAVQQLRLEAPAPVDMV